jgi:hypothetical protein
VAASHHYQATIVKDNEPQKVDPTRATLCTSMPRTSRPVVKSVDGSRNIKLEEPDLDSRA